MVILAYFVVGKHLPAKIAEIGTTIQTKSDNRNTEIKSTLFIYHLSTYGEMIGIIDNCVKGEHF